MLDLIGQVVRRASAGEPVAVCVVARTRGSTPQKAGAAMLVLQSGQTLGTLGGGCVEAEVRTRALELISARESRLLTFRLDQDYGWDDGLVCGGVMEIAVQTVASAEDAATWEAAASDLRRGREAHVVMKVRNEANEVVTAAHRFDPTPRLVIAGAGHVGGALASVAHTIGFDVTAIDDRPDCVSADRFPHAERIVGDIESELRRLSPGPHTYVVIVTRGHRHDAAALAAIVGSSARYIGLIGSRRKAITILESLRAEGVPAEQLARVHTPIGLRIGAVTPGEIAVSIAAEIVAVRRDAELVRGHSMRLSEPHLALALGESSVTAMEVAPAEAHA